MKKDNYAMKKSRLLLLLLLMMAFISSKAQETVSLVFTTNTNGGLYCPFDAVNVTNVTRGWTETLAYPDTILVLNSTVGLDEQYGTSFYLGEAYPNPFTNETNVPLEMPVAGVVFIQVFRVDGTVVVTSQNHLEAGLHRVKVCLSTPSMVFLVATSAQGRQVVRMINTGNSGENSITVESASGAGHTSSQRMRGNATGEFQPGDMMRYTAVLYDGANIIYSNTITQQQYESQTVTLHFDLTIPEVVTNQVIDITQTTALGGGNVTATGGVSVIERDICWSTSHNPTINSTHVNNGIGTGTFSVLMSGLTAGHTYYVRAYAINSFGTAYGSEVSFTTSQIPNYTISVMANPTNGGTVSGGGTFQQGQNCTVIAMAANGYCFTNWTENGSVVSTNSNYTFTVNSNRTLVAHFSAQAPNTYTINALPNPSNGGLVTGGGTYQQGQSCTVTATANTGYTFLGWTENGSQVSTNTSYTFTVTSNRTLVAQFQLQSYTINVSVNPTNGGSVTGGGSYSYGQSCTVTATANTGYTFLGWTENGSQVSTNTSYTFTVTGNRTLVAQFQANVTIPTVTTNQISNITSTTATGGGNVTSNGGTAVTERGICWSTSHNPTISNSHMNNGSGTGNYTINMTNLTPNTTYYVRAYAINSVGIAYGTEVSFSTSATTPTVTTSPVFNITPTTATCGGDVTSDGGAPVTARGVCWCNYESTVNPSLSNYHTSDGTGVGSFTSSITNLQPGHTYKVRAYATNSEGTSYGQTVSFVTSTTSTITGHANPSNWGSVSGGGTYLDGQSCTVTATANEGYYFRFWTYTDSNPPTVYYHYEESLTFTVTHNLTLTAYFAKQPPIGACRGIYSVSATQRVYFSQGNLQYQPSTNTWRFAENQWNYQGGNNANISPSYNGWIDLFGWGTSGNNHGAICYQPWSTSTNSSDYYAYGNYSFNLFDQTGQADWGYNPIINGGNQDDQWRTLTKDEWVYVFNTRATSSGIRYAKAQVNGVKGVILLPDNWSTSYYSLSNTNTSSASFSSNVITSSQWEMLEYHGAVFLPASGNRYGVSIRNAGSEGIYSSATYYGGTGNWSLFLNSDCVEPFGNVYRSWGVSVRLVKDFQQN